MLREEVAPDEPRDLPIHDRLVSQPESTAPHQPAIPSEDADIAQRPLGRVPYITLWAFCETSEFSAALEKAVSDRRMSRVDVKVQMGGLRSAAGLFSDQATPDLIIIEADQQEDELFRDLDALAEVCDSRTKVVLVGTVNDISFYRRLMERGITEYLVSPVSALNLIGVVIKLFEQDKSGRLGKVYAFIGAKGGTGSSTLAQNTAWCLAQDTTKVMLADLDLQFGTAALNYNIDATVGFAEQLSDAAHMNDALLERMLYKYGSNLSVLASANPSQTTGPLPLDVLDRILDHARSTFPLVLLDLPHEWTPWVRRALSLADEVVITAEPDLANLRNARAMVDLLRAARPNDADPVLVLNRVGIAKRDEVKPDAFASALRLKVTTSFGFSPGAYSRAANAGQMVAEVSVGEGNAFRRLAQTLTGRTVVEKRRSFLRWRGQT